MEEDPFATSRPKMIPPLSNFKLNLEDHDYMELVWENGQILTRGRRCNDHNLGSTQNPRTTSLLDLYEAEYYDILIKRNTGDGSDKNLGDTRVVPVPENPSSDAKSPPPSVGVLPEASHKSTEENITLSMFFKPQAVAVVADDRNGAIEVEPKTGTGLPEPMVLDNEKERDFHQKKEKERDVSRNEDGVESMSMIEAANGLRALPDHLNQKNLLRPKKETVEFSPSDAESVAMGRCGEMVGAENEEKETSDLLGWSTELCSTSMSICSRGSSEDPISSLRRTYAESEGSTYLSSTLGEESDDAGAQVPARTRRTAPKRKQSVDIDDLSERERKHEINKRLRALQKLLPNCNKDDKASLLDEAIKYTRKLQLQIQFRMMSMANGFVAPHMMLPLAHYSPVGLGIGTPQFVPSLVPAAALPGIGHAMHMLGFPNQPGMMPMFDPMETSSQQSAPPPSVPAAASSRRFQRSASMSSLDDSVHKSNQETVDRPSAHSQMPEYSQVKNENPEHLDGQAGK